MSDIQIGSRELVMTEDGKLVWREMRPRSHRHSGHFWNLYQDGSADPPLPKEPLKSHPGTLARVYELEQRAARGEHLWHPDDSTTLEGFQGDFFSASIWGDGPRHQYKRKDVGGRGGTYLNH